MTNRPTRATVIMLRLSSVLLVGAVVFTAFIALGALLGFGPNGDDVSVHTRIEAARIVTLPPDAVAPDHVDVITRVRDASMAQLRWAAARDLAPGALVIGALWLIRGLLRSVHDGDAFTEANVGRLRLLALVVLVGVPISNVVSSISASELATNAGFDGRGVEVSLPAGAVLGGGALLVLVQVFASGVRLRDDLEGTV